MEFVDGTGQMDVPFGGRGVLGSGVAFLTSVGFDGEHVGVKWVLALPVPFFFLYLIG